MDINRAQPQLHLLRGLRLTDTISLVVGIVIGTGVFLKPAVMAQTLGTPLLVLAAWVVAGLLTLAGTLVYAELGGLVPLAGGEYAFLRAAYGEGCSFFFGWTRLAVGSTGSIASLAVGFVTFLSVLVPLNAVWMERNFVFLGQRIHWQFGIQQIVAMTLIVLVSALNCAGVALGGRVQSIVTGLKLLGMAIIVGGVFLFSGHVHLSNLAGPQGFLHWTGFSTFSIAMVAALWAYDGWNQMPMVAGEVQNPGRNIPRALIAGMLIVMASYMLMNLAFFVALPVQEISASSSTLYRDAPPVASKAAETFLGSFGGKLISIVFIVSTLGALNGTVLTCARVPFAMARDGLFFNRFGALSRRARVPVFSIAIQALWSSILAISGTFDQLTDCVIFSSWIFYALVVSSVFVLRRKFPRASRPYRTLGYPFVPIIFIATAAWLVLNTLSAKPLESGIGLAFIACGIPFYWHFRNSHLRPTQAPSIQDLPETLGPNEPRRG